MLSPRLVPLVIVLAVGAARGDEVVLRSGRRLVGRTAWTADGLRVETRLGIAVIPRGEVEEVLPCELPEQVLARRRAMLAPDDLPGMVGLAGCALRADLEREARELLLAVVGAAVAEAETEDQARARRDARLFLLGLDFHQVEGRWVAPEVYYPARGFVRRGGSWVPAEELARARADAAADAARAQVSRAELERERAELDLARAEAELAAREEAHQAAREQARALEERVGQAQEEVAERARAEVSSDRVLAGKWSKLGSFACKTHGRECPEDCESQKKRDELKKAWEKQKQAEGKTDEALARARAKLDQLDLEWSAARKRLSRERQRLAEAGERLEACQLALARLGARGERARARCEGFAREGGVRSER